MVSTSFSGKAFISPDWAGKAEPVPYAKMDNPQSLNLYAYAGNNPVGNVDADGHIYNGSSDSGGYLEGDDPYHQDQQRAAEFAAMVQNGWEATVNQINSEAQQQNNGQNLKYKTVSGGQHSSSWEINWSLTHNTKKGGYIVQHIVADFEGSTQCGGHGQCDYWEAWPVAPNSHTPSIHGVDANGNSYTDMFGGGAGSHIHASASFYEGLTLPSSFIVQPEGFPARGLRATTSDPNLATDNATAPNVRWWGAP